MDLRVATCVGARAGLAVPARGRPEPGTGAHRHCGRAGPKRSEGAEELEDQPGSGTERRRGLRALTDPAWCPPGSRRIPAPSIPNPGGPGPLGDVMGGEGGGGWRSGGNWIPGGGGGGGLGVAGVSSKEVRGLRTTGRDSELLVEAAVLHRVGVKQLLGGKASQRAAARRGGWRGLGTVGDPDFGIHCLSCCDGGSRQSCGPGKLCSGCCFLGA